MSEAPKIEPLGCDEWDFLRDDDSAPRTDLADVLAAALRRARPTVVNMAHSWEAEARLLNDIDAALAAYEARK